VFLLFHGEIMFLLLVVVVVDPLREFSKRVPTNRDLDNTATNLGATSLPIPLQRFYPFPIVSKWYYRH